MSLDDLLETPVDRRTFLKMAFTGVLSVLISEKPVRALVRSVPRSVAIVFGGSCGGCTVTMTEIGMDLKALADVDPVFGTLRRSLVYCSSFVDRTLDDFLRLSSVDVTLVTGSVGPTTHDFETVLEHAREISTTVIAVGDCAWTAGVTRLSPYGLKPVSDSIVVDEYVPGCPPRPEHVWYAMTGGAVGEPPASTEPGGGRSEPGFKTVCRTCVWRRTRRVAHTLAEPGCRGAIGCKGSETPNCAASKSTAGISPCTAAGDLCIGCYSDRFPKLPFYKYLARMPSKHVTTTKKGPTTLPVPFVGIPAYHSIAEFFKNIFQ
ncbi:NADH-quinone oxidoreductase subunit B family protein [Methanopyrus sp.]